LLAASETPNPIDTHKLLDLIVTLSLGVKVTSSLSTSHVQTGKSVLEDLLESEAGWASESEVE